MRRLEGISILDVLVAAVILSLAIFPLMGMASTGFGAASADRTAVDAEGLCHDVLERLGRGPDNVAAYLGAPDEDGVRRGVNIWKRWPALAAELGAGRVRALEVGHALELTLTLAPAACGMERLTCAVTWTTHEGGRAHAHRVEYGRFVVQARPEPWS